MIKCCPSGIKNMIINKNNSVDRPLKKYIIQLVISSKIEIHKSLTFDFVK